MTRLRVLTTGDWRLFRGLRLEALRDAPYAFNTKLADWQGATPDGSSSVVQWAKEQGARGVTLSVMESNVRALNLYRRNAFVDEGSIETEAEPQRQMFCAV